MMARRLARIRLDDRFYPMLALDHGLTNGTGDVVPAQNVAGIVESCSQDIGSVVLTYGLAMSNRGHIKLPLILQCFGAPLGLPRVKICTIEQALRLDAAAVAVQIDFAQREHLSCQIREISSFVSEAHAMGMPVLFMTTGAEPKDLDKVSQSIRMCQELGADLIKIRCIVPEHKDSPGAADLILVIKHAPPLLLTGGGVNTEIVTEVTRAKSFGFSGYCIGRNIFKAETPSKMARELRNAFVH